jgi:3'(2'), 5'-bisphosphate nucleotidase
MMYEKELEVAVGAVAEASLLCRAVQTSISVGSLEKKDRSPVTVADFGSQAIVCRVIGDAFPDDPIIAEEDSAALEDADNAKIAARLMAEMDVRVPGAGREQVFGWIDRGGASEYSDRFWTLDPIDGTKGFLRGDQYAVSLALIVGGDLVVAVLACPNLPEEGTDSRGAIFSAVRGEGAFTRPLGGGEPIPVSVSEVMDAPGIRFCESVEAAHSSHSDSARIAERLAIAADPVRIDSQAKYAMVARGTGDAYMRLPKSATYVEKIWDHAGGALVVEEAGGRVSDIAGMPLDFTHGRKLEKNRGIIVTNGKVHDEILKAISELGIAG